MPLNDEQQAAIQGIEEQTQQFDPEQGPGPGDPKPGKVVPIKKGASTQGLSPDAISRISKNVQEGTSGVKQDVPENLHFQPKAGQDNYLLRAQDQGFMAQLGKTVGNLIPNVAADMLNMVGELPNLGATAEGASDYDSGGFGKLATAIRDPFGEVYREHPDKTFDLGDSAWWLQNIAGFAEGAASFVLPGEGEAAIFSKLGKLAAESGAGRMGLEATKALGHTISAFSMGYLMSADAGKKVYDESYKTNYDRFIRQGYDPGYADDNAKHMAAEGAAKTVQIGTLLNGILNLTALAPLFKGTPQEAIQGMFKGGEGALQPGENITQWGERLKGMNPEEHVAGMRAGLTSHGFQAFQVGLQGLNTEYAEKTGTALGTDQRGKQLDMISDYFDKVTDQEGALNMLSGLLGGLTQNILMDRVPLHRIIKIDPVTNKPVYKDDPNIMDRDGKPRYQTQLVSARTRDMMNNRQYFSSVKDATMADITRMQELQKNYEDAKAKGDALNADKYRSQLTAVGDLNAVTMGTTENWQEVYKKMSEHEDLKEPAQEAILQLKGLESLHQKVANRFAAYGEDPEMMQLQDHVFNQEANHYLLGRAITKEDGRLAGMGTEGVHPEVYKHIAASLDKDIKALEKDPLPVLSRYGVNVYDEKGVKKAADRLAERLRAEQERMTGSALPTDAPVDVDIAGRQIGLERARVEHNIQQEYLRDLHTKEGRDEFLGSLRKQNAKWKTALDTRATKDVENLFLKQQDKESAAKLDKNQQAELYNNAREQRLANDDKTGLLKTELAKHQADLREMEGKKGFFKNIKDLPTKLKARIRAAQIQAEIAHLEHQNEGHNKTMQALSGNIQDAAIKEDTARNAYREDVENDMHSQQDITAPTKTDDTPDNGIAGDESAIPKSVGQPSEETYASLRESLQPQLQTVLDTTELLMPEDEFQRDLVHKALAPYVADQRISQETVHELTEKMKDWWDEKKSRMEALEETLPQPSTAPVPNDAVLSQDNQVSDIPEPDSPLISYNSAMNVDNMGTPENFSEVGAKALTSMKVNSRSIEYMRIEKDGKLLFLPLYDKLDPTFNRNLLKPGFVAEGDGLHFEVDKDWNGQVTLDRADAPDEYGMPTTRADSFSDYSTPDGKIIMTKQADDLEPAYANAPIKIIHTKSGETIGYLPRVDWVTAKRPDSGNYRNIEDNIRNEDGTISSGNVDAQRAKLLAVRSSIAQAHNRGEEPVRTHVSGTGPGHLFLATDVNVNSEKSKLAPKLAKNLLPDKKLIFGILDKGTMMVGHGTPLQKPANFDAKSLAKKYQTGGEQWNNTPMVLLPMPNGKLTESPLFTRKLEKRPADIHTVAKAVESYLAHGTAAETPEHTNIIDKVNQHTGYDITTAGGLRSFINQYYTYTQKFSEVHTRSNAETSGPKTPRFMLDIPALQPGEQKAAIKVGTSFSGSSPLYALTRDGKINPEFDQALRDGLQTHYKNVVYTSQDIKGINDSRPITAVTIQRDGKVRTDKYESYNEYAKSFTSTVVYGEHRANDGSYLYGANPITEFDFSEAVKAKESGGNPEDWAGYDDLIGQMMNSAVGDTSGGKDHPMYYKMAAGANKTGKDTSTLELAESGARTATTRSQPLGKVGDIITFEGRPQKYEITGLEKLTLENVNDPAWIQKWSDKEQWTADYFKTILGGKTVHVGSWQTSFKKIENIAIEQKIPTAKTYTKDQLTTNDKGQPIAEGDIVSNIGKLYDEATSNPEQQYTLDIPGAGKSSFKLSDGSRMTHFKLAQLLNNKEIPYNIKLSDDIRSVLENTPKRFLNSMMFQDDSMFSPLPIDEKILGEQLDNTFVPVRDENGNHTGGYFSPERQEAVVDSVVKAISLQLDRKPVGGEVVRVGDMAKTVKNNVFANLKRIYDRIAAGESVRGFDVPAEQAGQLAKEFGMVLNSFEPHATSLSFWGEAMKKLDGLGIRVKENNRPVREDMVPELTNGNDEVFEGTDGKGRDWFDDHFEQNPMDSASSRIKFFLASTTDSTVGSEEKPPEVKLSFADPKVRSAIVKETKLFTTRTAEQAKALGLDKVGAEALTKVDGKDFRVTAIGTVQEGDAHVQQIGAEEGTEPVPGDMKLQLAPWKAKTEQLIPNRNYLGLPKLANYEQLYEDSMATLGDTPRDFKSYVARLKEEGLHGKPNLYALATNLEKANPQTQREFVSVMTLHYQPFTMVLADAKTDFAGKPFYALRTINANRASQLNVIVDHWQQSQKFSSILRKDSGGITIVDHAVAQQLKAGLDAVNKAFNAGDKDAPNKAKDLLRQVLEHNGIVLPEKGLESFISNTLRWTKKTSLAGDFRKQFAVTEDGKAQGLVSAFVLRLTGMGGEEELLDSADDKSYQLNNPLYTEGTAVKVLSRVAAAYTPNLYSNTHRSSEGKSIYDWGLPHKLSNDFGKLKSNEQWRAQFKESDFAKRSWLLEHINNNPELRDRVGLSYLDGIRAAYGKQDSGTTRPAMSDREQLLTSVGLFQNGNDNRYAHYLSLTHSDRSTTPVFLNMPRIPQVTTMRMEYDKLSGIQVPKFRVHDEVIKRLYDTFLSEYDRIRKAAQVIEKSGGYNDERYEKGSQFFYTLPQFNHDRMQGLVKDGKITEGEFNSIWMMGEKKLNVLEGRGFKEAVDKVLRQHVEDLMVNTVKEWREKGILEEKNVPFDRRYTNKLLSYVSIHSNKDGTYRSRDNQPIPEAYVTKLSAQLVARDYAVNSFLFNTSLSQVLYGDPAQNWKGSVEKTMVEYGKRLTQFISPRKEGSWDNPTYQSVTVKDFTTNPNYLGALSEAYKDVNATDAQELTTVQEKLNVLRAYGRIAEPTYLEMTQIIKDAKGGYYEFTKPEHLAIVMQPEKPLYSGSRAPFQGAILNDYVKSSAYALYPPLLAGKELDKLRIAMEKGGVDRLNFESAKKVGIPAKGLQLFDNAGKINEDVFKEQAWTGTDRSGQPGPSARQELSRDNFGLSQEVPYDETKEAIRTVSQMNKLIVEAIPTVKGDFAYQGEKLSGAELATRKEDIRKEMIDRNQQKLIEETGARINEEGNLVIKDRQKIYDALLKHAEEQGGYSPNDLAILQHTLPGTDELIVPLMYSPSASKFESLVMSMVNGITDIYMPGKSYVQASSAGHRMVKALGELSEAERKNIIHIGDWDGGELKIIRKEDGTVKAGQILLPFNFQINGRPVPIDGFVLTDENGRRSLDMSRVPKELLELVAARIPNSGHNLMHPMEIVGFVPDNMGDLAIVPDAITRQMGSDFDVDKLYTYRRGYQYNKETKGFELSTEDEAKLKNDYFDTHWAVLMHPEMTAKIQAPLDKEDLKNEAREIEQWESKGKAPMSFYDPMYQLKDYQSQKDAKRLVGASSLSVTFNAVIQDKELTIGFLGLDAEGRMHPVTQPIKIIDEDGKVRKLSHLSGYGRSEYRADGEKTGEMRTKNDNHVMQQAEFLDYSKNRVSDKVHLTVQTYPASAALTQLQEADGTEPGWTPSIKYNTRLLSQPIIQEYAQMMAQSQDTFSEDFDPDRKNSIIEQLATKYINEGKVDPSRLLLPKLAVSFEDLTDALKKGPAQADYHFKQLRALELFKELDQVGSQMMTAQNTINQDVNGAGPNLLTTLGKDYTRARIEIPLFSANDKLAILGAERLYTRKDGTPTEQGHLYDTVHKAAYGIAGEFFPYREMKPFFDYVMSHTNREDLSVDMQKSVFNAMKSYLFSHPKLGLWEDPVGTRAKLLYGEQSLAKRVLEAKNTWAKNDVFLQRMQTDIDPDGLRPDYLKYQASKITKMDLDENTRHWVDLLTSDDPQKAQLGHDLVRYAYLTGGIQDSQNFIKFLPYSFLLGTDFGHKLRELTGGIDRLVTSDAFTTQVFQHNPQIAKHVSEDFRETGGKLDKHPERFTLPAIEAENPKGGVAGNLVVRAVDTDGKTREMYPAFISHYSKLDNHWILYKKASLFNGSEFGCDYVRIDTLGDANTDEYSYHGTGLAQRSLIPSNRSFAYDNIEPAFRMLNSAVTHDHSTEVLKDFHIPTHGGHKELAEILTRAAIDPAVPEHSKVLSSWLATLHEQGKGAAEALAHIYGVEHTAFLPDLRFKVVKTQQEMTALTGSPWSAASMDSKGNVLYLGEQAITDKAKLVELMNHELIHYHTATLTMLGEDQQYMMARHKGSLDTIRFAQTLYRNITDKNPEIKVAIDDLHTVRRQALDAIKADILKRGLSFEQEYDKVTRQGRIENEWHKMIYAASSNTEFISHVLTDVKFMRYLNSKTDSKGILGRVADIVKRLMSAVATALGTDVRKGSLLESAIDKSMALMLQGRADAVPDREQMATPNNIEQWMNNAVVSNPTLTAMDRLAGKLQEQHDEIANSLTGRLTKEAYSEKRTKLDAIEEDINNLRQHQSFQVATDIGNKHLKWVEETMAQDKPTTSQIMTANRILEVWGNLIPLVYGSGEGTDAPDPGFAELSARAQDMDFKMLKKSEQALIDLSSGVITMRDYSPAKLKDISKDQALLRDVVSAAGSKVTQYIGTHLQTVARQAADDVTRLVKETRAVEQGVAAAVGGKDNLKGFYDQFFQENKKGDAWGLIQRFSQNWYDFRRSERTKRSGAMKRIDAGGGDPAQKAQMKAQAWEHYWKTMDKHAIFADTRKLFDAETGELKEDDASKAHIAELEKHTDKETARELVDEAKTRYRQYLDHKEPYFDELNASGKTPEEIKKLKDDFVNKWSPNAFFANRGGKFGSYGGSDYYAKMAPRRASKEFYDEKFDKMKQNPAAAKYYAWLTGKLNELKAALPIRVNDEYLGANFFPVVKKSLFADMIDIPEYVRTMGERTMQQLGATPFEESRNASTFRQIPIDYVDRDQKRNPLETRSKDIPRVLEAFGMMAMHYKHFSDARDSIDMGEAILQKLDQARAGGATQMEVKGKLVSVKDGLKNTLDALKYMKDYLIYRKARELEGKSDMKLYSLNPVEQIKTSNKVKELLTQRDKLEQQVLNGEIDPEEGAKLIGPINAELMEHEGLRIYGSKLGDKLISINQLKTLSYNPFSGLANMTFGVVSAGIHANGERDFSWSDLGQSLKIMMSSTAKWLSFGSRESENAQKILAVMDRTGVIGDVVDSHYGKVHIRDNKAAWKHAVNPFNWMRSGDYFMKGLTTVAMMLHDKVEVTEAGEKKTISLWDALDKEGKWNSARYGERKDWYSSDVQEQGSWDKFRNKAVRVNMIIHGNQDKTSPKLANKFILGRLLGQFRMSWLPEGWYSRFQKEHFDIQLDREVKGRYRTISQLGFGGYAMVTLKQLYSLVGKVDPYSGTTRLDGKGLTDTDRENMRRNFAELAFVSTIMGAVVMTRAMAADNEDQKEVARLKLLMNMLIRNKQDLEFYASPQVFDTVTRDIIPAANVIKDFGKAISATGKLIMNDDYQFQQWLLAMTHAGIPIPQATLINKTIYMTSKDLDNSPY